MTPDMKLDGIAAAAPSQRHYALISPGYPGFAYDGTGLTAYARLVAEALASRGWSVDVILFHTVGDRPASAVVTPSIRVIVVPMPRLHWRLAYLLPFVRGVSLFAAVRRLDKSRRYTAAEAPNYLGLGWMMALGFRRRFFLRMHSSYAQQVAAAGERPDRSQRVKIRWDRLTARLARNLVTHSASHARSMAVENEVPVDRIDIVPHATPRAVGQAGGLEHRSRILYVGTMERRKGIDVFIEGSRIARSRGLVACWTAVGRKHERWQEHARESGGDLVFTGRISDEELERYWQESRCVVVPSRYESFGLVAIEAMARGIPVIAARGGALPEVVGDAGILVDPEHPEQIVDAVERLFGDPDLERRLSAAGLDRYQSQFSMAVLGARLERLILDRTGG